MTQTFEKHTSRTEEESVTEEQVRNVGNQALQETAESADKTIDLIDELLADEDFSEEQAQTTVDNFQQKNGQ